MGNVLDLHKSPVHCNGRVLLCDNYIFMLQPTFFSNVYILLQVKLASVFGVFTLVCLFVPKCLVG